MLLVCYVLMKMQMLFTYLSVSVKLPVMREREVISEKENKLVLGGKPLFGVCVLPLMLKGSADSGAFFSFSKHGFLQQEKGL